MNESVQRLESKCVGARSEEALNIDLNESVQRLEAKCAGVREELGNMALSEQYMRTKQAQLRARKKELEAKQATIKAELREKEAAVSKNEYLYTRKETKGIFSEPKRNTTKNFFCHFFL